MRFSRSCTRHFPPVTKNLDAICIVRGGWQANLSMLCCAPRKKRILVIVDDGVVFVIVIVVITDGTGKKNNGQKKQPKDNCIAARANAYVEKDEADANSKTNQQTPTKLNGQSLPKWFTLSISFPFVLFVTSSV